jgi:allantoate deiminase
VEVIGFSEEEGVRYAAPYLGSRAMAGTFDPALLQRRDANGISMAEAIESFGLDSNWQSAGRDPDGILAYLEAHIEQGPVLERLDQPLAVVTAIAGQSRYRVRFRGQPGHAGTLPMAGRQDALAAASEWILAVEKAGGETEGAVATVGSVTVTPNAGNVVPGEVLCSLDVRHARDEVRLPLVEQLLDTAEAIAARRGIACETELVSRQNAVPMDSEMCQLLHEAAGELVPGLVSGAGHDAAIMAGLVPAGLLFLRNPGGLSHCPEESVTLDDVAEALDAIWRFVGLLAGEFEKGG